MPDTIETIAEKRCRWVEANRENNFEAGLKRLLSDLYPDNAHFIYELLQNAEDARAQEVRFTLHEDRIEFEHDGERLFSVTDVDAITSIGFSTKRDDVTSIGKFGVGFKAVFAYTETPEVESGDFHFRIRDMVVPEPDGLPGRRSGNNQTRFILPFDNLKKPKERARSEVERLLKALGATTLLFLTHIRKIEYLLPDSSLGYIERIELGGNRFEIRVQLPNELSPLSTWLLKFDKVVQVEDDEAENENQRMKTCRIAVAFGLNPVEPKSSPKEKKADGDAAPEWELAPMDPGRVCIYFPADKETSNLCFHLHAPFASTVARDSVRDCAGNNLLRDHLGNLLAESMAAIRDQGLLTVRALAVLPNDKDNLPEFYQPLMDRLIEDFKRKNLVPMRRGGHAAADGIFRGTKALSDLIDDDDMVILLGNDLVTPVWASNPPQRNQREDNFLSMLEIEEWTSDELENAISELDDESLAEWIGTKSEEWHQRMYALLEEHADELVDVKVIRCSDGAYRRGNECFFPTDGVERHDKFPRVAKGVYFDGGEENKKVREFLEAVGVREVDGRVEIEAILASYYTYESETPNRKDHYSHLRRFMRFLEENPGQYDLLSQAYLFMVDGEEDIEWMQPSGVYLDKPYADTGLSTYYEAAEVKDKKWPLSSVYRKSGINLEKLSKFCRALDVVCEIRLTKCSTPWGYAGDGRRQTGSCIDEDYKLPQNIVNPERFKHTDKGLRVALLIWKTMSQVPGKQLHGRYRPNRSHSIEHRPSQAIDLLRDVRWVPQKGGRKIEFVRPRDAVAEKLPAGFEYQPGWQWLLALEFGKGVEERREAQRKEQERHSQEYKREEQVLRKFGFDSPEDAEEMARLKKEDPEGFQKWRESRQSKPAFPERSSANADRRRSKAVEKATDAPDKLYEEKPRRVRPSNPQVKAEADAYLRDLYTKDDDQLICQICQDEMPFRKKNGNHYFEKVEAFGLPKESSANHLALCPVCAAKYREFVFLGPDDARGKLRQAFADLGDVLELPVALGEEAATICFVECHAIDLRAAIGVSEGAQSAG